MWNWWGFALAFGGIITLIPIRGMYKMMRRRARFLGEGTAYDLGKTVLLVAGLGMLLYGFLSAFMGRVPIEDLRPHDRLGLEGGLMLGGGTLVFLVREALKRRLPEGAEGFGTLFFKQLLLYVGTGGFLYGFITLFMAQWMHPHFDANPWGFWMGVGFMAAGAIQILLLRPFALRNELAGTVRVMVGMLADSPPDARAETMRRRMAVIASLPLAARTTHVRLMLDGLARLDPHRRELMDAARMETMAALRSADRQRVMEAMDVVLTGALVPRGAEGRPR